MPNPKLDSREKSRPWLQSLRKTSDMLHALLPSKCRLSVSQAKTAKLSPPPLFHLNPFRLCDSIHHSYLKFLCVSSTPKRSRLLFFLCFCVTQLSLKSRFAPVPFSFVSFPFSWVSLSLSCLHLSFSWKRNFPPEFMLPLFSEREKVRVKGRRGEAASFPPLRRPAHDWSRSVLLWAARCARADLQYC